MKNTFKVIIENILLIILGVVLVAGVTYGFFYAFNLYKKIENDKNKLVSNAVSYEDKVKKLEEDLSKAKEEKENISETLNQLKNIDPELLKKYSKVYFLNENYVPATLVNINPLYSIDPNKNLRVLDKIDPFLESMLKDANDNDVPLRITSAYRSFTEQKALKSGYKVIYGAKTANQFSADQGYSEHQLGTTLDFTTPSVKGAFPAFQDSTSYKWLNENAYKYGFVISYPKENKYYEYESWHWRFVGKELATYIHDNRKYFYELDQRFIDTYLTKIFDLKFSK